jgi:hypothetical protein
MRSRGRGEGREKRGSVRGGREGETWEVGRRERGGEPKWERVAGGGWEGGRREEGKVQRRGRERGKGERRVGQRRRSGS